MSADHLKMQDWMGLNNVILYQRSSVEICGEKPFDR